MKDYAYIFTIFSGTFAIIQMIRLFYPWFFTAVENFKKKDVENTFSANYSLNSRSGFILHVITLFLLFIVSILVVYQRFDKLNKQYSTSELETKIDNYHAELNKIKIEVSRNIKNSLDSDATLISK